MTARPVERDAIIAGTAQSAIGRRLHRPGLDLTIDAALGAIADAGLRPSDIDGISTYPGSAGSFGGASGAELHEALRLDLRWRDGASETSGQLGAVHKAALAVAAGLARNVVVFRTVVEGSQRSGGVGARSGPLPQAFRFLLPYGAASPANWVAFCAMRHMHEYGTTPEQLGAITVNGRRNAALNPQAIYTDPLSLDEYLASRLISDPLRLYDCDVPCDGSTAVVVSHRDLSGDLDHPAVGIHAMGTAIGPRPSWDQIEDLTTMPLAAAARSLWARADVTPGDVDVAQIYDGFSWLTLAWIEALGFCGPGEAGAFVEGGSRIGPDGDLPLNSWGGQLSGGRLHGFGFLHEAVLQLRGEAGPRQVDGAEVAVVAAGGGPEVGALLLTRGCA